MGRNPRQRDLILSVYQDLGRPLSAQEALEEAQTRSPGIGIATAYRAVNRLVEDGVLKAAALPGEAVRYEIADQPHHHFFHCNACEHVYPVESCPKDIGHMVPKGFTLESHEVVLYGTCPDCDD